MKRKAKRKALKLPTTKTKPMEKLSDYSILLYGEKKIGKTSLCAQFPNALMLFCEPGGKALSTYAINVKSWLDIVDAVDLLDTEEHSFSNVVIDTADIAYKLCFKHMCEKLLITHPQDEKDFGKSWGLIRDEFARVAVKLLSLGLGVVFTSHAIEKELKTRTGKKYHRICPTMGGQAEKVLTGLMDCIFYYEYNGDKRQLVIEGNELITAGTRIEDRFQTEDGSKLNAVPMGNSASEAYENLTKAFNNKLALPSRKPAKRKRLKLPSKKQ